MRIWTPRISVASHRSILLVALAVLAAPSGIAAQGFRASGVIRHVGPKDTVPLRGSWAVLHEVSMTVGAPVDSARTDAGGAYRLRSLHHDTSAVYFVSVSYAGINYVSRPIRQLAKSDARAESLFVYDTSSTGTGIVVAQRHLIVRSPDADRSRHVLELVVLTNTSRVTLIANDTVHPVWGAVLPKGAIQLQVGESDVSDRAVMRRGDSIAVFAPVPPGDKQLMFQYILPASQRDLVLSVDQPMARLNVLVEDTLAVLAEGAMQSVGMETMEGTRFARFAGEDVHGGLPIVVQFQAAPASADQYWWIIVVAAAVGLSGVLVFWLRRRPASGTVSAEAIAAEIAVLDQQFEAASTGGPPGDAEAYHARRAQLKARLNDVLATGGQDR